MRFLQASDFHLDPGRPERLAALREVVDRARAERADVLLLPGDLFDSPAAADALRGEVRGALDRFEGRVLITPGNHDEAASGARSAFPHGADYGARVRVLAARPWERLVLPHAGGDVAVVGVPFRSGSALGRDLAGVSCDPRRSVLLAHGTFQSAWVEQLGGSGDENEAYYPVRPRDLEGRFAYAALGHVHAGVSFDGWTAERAWGYAGSPVAIRRSEPGPRHAVLVDFEPGAGVRALRAVRLDTPYWETRRVGGSPRESPQALLDRLRRRIDEDFPEADPRRGLLVRVEGWVGGSEVALREGLARLSDELREAHREVAIDCEARTAEHLLHTHPWLSELLERARALAAERGADDATLRSATDLLVEAAAAGD